MRAGGSLAKRDPAANSMMRASPAAVTVRKGVGRTASGLRSAGTRPSLLCQRCTMCGSTRPDVAGAGSLDGQSSARPHVPTYCTTRQPDGAGNRRHAQTLLVQVETHSPLAPPVPPDRPHTFSGEMVACLVLRRESSSNGQRLPVHRVCADSARSPDLEEVQPAWMVVIGTGET